MKKIVTYLLYLIIFCGCSLQATKELSFIEDIKFSLDSKVKRVHSGSFLCKKNKRFYFSDLVSRKEIRIFDEKYKEIKCINLKKLRGSSENKIMDLFFWGCDKIIFVKSYHNNPDNSILITDWELNVLDSMTIPNNINYEYSVWPCYNTEFNEVDSSILLKRHLHPVTSKNKESIYSEVKRHLKREWEFEHLLRISNLGTKNIKFINGYKRNKKISPSSPLYRALEYSKVSSSKNKTIAGSFYSNKAYLLDNSLKVIDSLLVYLNNKEPVCMPIIWENKENNNSNDLFAENLKNYNHIDNVFIHNGNYNIIIELKKKEGQYYQDWVLQTYGKNKEKISETYFKGKEYEPFVLADKNNRFLIKKRRGNGTFSIYTFNQ